MERNENDIELRTSEIDAILGKSPNWIMRTGIGIICISVLILLVGSVFFYYPETISCSINITTNLPPSHLINKGGGLIEKMYVEKNNIVKKDQILAVIKNSANVDDVLWLKLVMDSISTEQYKNKVNIFASKEDMLYQALQVNSDREQHYCRKVDKRFLEELNRRKPTDLQTIKRLWYGDDREYHSHYDPSRYRCLNLHPVFTDNNIEVRAFNGCLNAGVLRAYISLVLAVSNQALTQKSASSRVTQSENPRYTFRTWLIRIGLNGQEFKNCRKHLLSHLEGNIAWLHPEDAVKQRERLKAERQAAREQRVEPVSEVQQLNENVPDENFEPSESECEDFEEDEEMGMEMSM